MFSVDTKHLQSQRKEFSEWTHQSRLLETLHPLQDKSGSGCDCTLLVENNQKVMIHSALLRSISPLMRSVWPQSLTICGGCNEAMIILPTVSMLSVTSFLNMVYTGSCTYKSVYEKDDIESLLHILDIRWRLGDSAIVQSDEEDIIASVEGSHSIYGSGGMDHTRPNKSYSINFRIYTSRITM